MQTERDVLIRIKYFFPPYNNLADFPFQKWLFVTYLLLEYYDNGWFEPLIEYLIIKENISD